MGIKIGKRLIADVFTLDFLKDEKTVISCDALTDSTIDITVSEKEVRGGQGNNLIATLHSGRDISIKANDVAFDFGVLATNLGSQIVAAAGVGYVPRKVYKVDLAVEAKTVTLEKAPIDKEKLEIFDKDGKSLAVTTDYTIAGAVLTLVGSKVNEGDEITVNAYSYKTNATTENISITADTYPSGGKLILTTLEIDATSETPVATIQFVFPLAKPSGNISFSTSSERDAMKSALDFKVIKGATSEIGYVYREELKTV